MRACGSVLAGKHGLHLIPNTDCRLGNVSRRTRLKAFVCVKTGDVSTRKIPRVARLLATSALRGQLLSLRGSANGCQDDSRSLCTSMTGTARLAVGTALLRYQLEPDKDAIASRHKHGTVARSRFAIILFGTGIRCRHIPDTFLGRASDAFHSMP